MNKTELVEAIAEKTGTAKKTADKTLQALLEVITETITAGDKVQLVGFGTFDTRVRAARKGYNPQTKAEIKIPACKVPAFKAGKALKEIVNK